ncbi:TPA: hypothetical protein SL658_001017 [Pseudomonas aeruginosa]|uniref:hypothetical protein n=1 Tax=Pseudomonas aeruginosa TaxID=287 RepID=UPI001886DF96|nr:hypothetical protein [Pseudomonas aeruginosa]MBF1865865.1 hypothetical protein [Pseudomonas aeruginosa]HBP5443628.1 hypothetical protein [Pseudomonas aeruginosa]HCF9849562.1 hypothetical protein [Pseudomonas aeruginosa]HEJ5133812.1 hypothetical protein [Pseudomonas aeruginosa]
MQHLRVSVKAGSPLALPIEIYSPKGSLIGSGAVSTRLETVFDLPMQEEGRKGQPLERVYVFAKLPGGATIQEVAELDVEGGEAVLNLAKSTPYEWLEWVTPFRSLHHLSGEQPHEPDGASVRTSRRIGKVWATLWEFQDQRWEARNVHFESRRGDRGICQLTIDVPYHPHLLQLGGEELAWRLVSLPPGELVKIALTPSRQEAGGDALDITVGRQFPENELVMSYLSHGNLPEASRLAELMHIADRMLHGKFGDPISAVAGGYILLKTNQLERRERWLRNLELHFPYIADVKILKAALAREQDGVSEENIRQMLLDALEVGLPVFSLGMTLLLDSMAAMHRGSDEKPKFHRAYLAVQAYVRAKCSKGTYLVFYGKSPAEPLWSPIYGSEQLGAATPVSQGSSPPVFMRRPKGSPRLVRYGATSVTLPQAPVSGQMFETRRLAFKEPPHSIEIDRWLSLSDLPRPLLEHAKRIRNSALPSVEIQELPEYLAVQEETDSAMEVVVINHNRPRQSRLPRSESTPELGGVVEPRPRQNAKYWQDARISHSISVMDEDE